MLVVRYGLPFILLLLACLNFNTSQNLQLWKASILVTEYGQWFVLLSLVLILIWYRDRVALVPLVIAVILFSIPTFQLFQNFKGWENDLTQKFGNRSREQVASLPDWMRLFSLSTPKAMPQTIEFSKATGEVLSFDFFKSSRPHSPFLLVIHGGGWDGGERTQFEDMNQYFANLGYAVASIDYRLAPKNPWPAQRDDVLNAITYLKTHAGELGIDPNQWVIFGRSAGGQIAESFAYQSPKPEGLKGCIAFYAPADMNFAYQFGDENDILKSPTLLRNYLGGTPKDVPANYNSASPLLAVTKDSVPTLLLHGPGDPLVWVKQSERLFAKLQSENVKSEFIRVPWATHGFDYHLNGPGGQIATFAVGRFLEGVLAP